jgi:hypothetical protein
MKTDNLVEQYQEIFRQTTDKIEKYNAWYCENFNNNNAIQYDLFIKIIYIGDGEYIFIDKKINSVQHYEFKLVSLQEHFNILSIIEHNIEKEILKRILNIMNDEQTDKIIIGNISILIDENIIDKIMDFEINDDDINKSFLEDLTTEEQIKLYEKIFQK